MSNAAATAPPDDTPQKIPSMVEDGIEKILLGITSIDELGRVVELPDPDVLAKERSAVATAPADVSDDDFLSHVI